MTKKRPKKSHAHFQISPQKNQSTFWYDWFFEILIIAFLAMMTFFVGGFEHILGWLIFLFLTGIILMCQYMERAFDTPQPTRTEIIIATTTKWIVRFFCFSLIVLLFYFIYLMMKQTQNGQNFPFSALIICLLLIAFCIHTFIYGAGSVRRSFAANRELYRQRKKRYKWKW